jgi:glycosidase
VQACSEMSERGESRHAGVTASIAGMRLLTYLLVTLSVIAGANAEPYRIDHVEPLSWWVGMKLPGLQLMIHGDHIADLQPAVDYPGVKVTGVTRTDNPNFLFIDLEIAANTQPGTFVLQLQRGSEVVVRRDYTLDARRPGSADRRGFDSHDAIYLITPDRFANAIPANDSVPEETEHVDRAYSDGRHGGDIAGMEAHLDYIRSLGFTMVWPTPILENAQPAYSYHGYSITDEYRVDPRFGSNADYRHFVQAAHERGIGVLQDIVLNHIGSGHWWMKDLPAHDWINYIDHPRMTNNQHTTAEDIHAAPEEAEQFVRGWFVPTMPDLNQQNPLLARYLIQNSIWWIEYADLSGIREDTFSYADPTFLHNWCTTILNEYPHFNIVGEEMDNPPHMVAYWQTGAHNRNGYDSGLPSVTDFPVVDLVPQVLTAPETWETGLQQLYTMIAADYLYGNPMNLLVFPDNHDRSRIFSRLHENLNLLHTELLFIATTRGIPQFYYGTEVLMKSPIERNDGLTRSDMPGGWAGDKVNAFTGEGLTAAQKDTQDFVRRLFEWRRGCAAVTEGTLTHYYPEGGCYVYFRCKGADRVMVVINKNEKATQLNLARFARMLGNTKQGRDVLAGKTVNLAEPLELPAQTSMAIEYEVAR